MMDKHIEKIINQIYEKVWNQVFSKRNIKKVINDPNYIAKTITKYDESRLYDEFAKRFSKILTKRGLNKTRGVWRKFFETAKREGLISPNILYSKYEQNIFNKVLQKNLDMIKSIPRSVLKVLKQKSIQTLKRQVINGDLGRNEFYKFLKQKGVINARLIARTETAKFQTAILKERSLELGSTAYIWGSNNDSRTRKSHRQMRDVVVFWTDVQENKPFLDNMYGDAGEFPNCRCSPQPILSVKSLKKPVYEVYDPLTKSIKKMGLKELRDKLGFGE